MTGAVVRLAVQTDAEPLAALKLRTFRETFLEDFAIPYPVEDLALFEVETYAPAVVAGELAAAGHGCWVAEDAGGALVAYCHVGPCKLPHPNVQPGAGEIRQLYMLRDWQGAGLGRVLMDRALAWLAVNAPGTQWLGVWSGNERAQRFYARYGFEKVGTYGFPVGAHIDREFIMRRG